MSVFLESNRFGSVDCFFKNKYFTCSMDAFWRNFAQWRKSPSSWAIGGGMLLLMGVTFWYFTDANAIRNNYGSFLGNWILMNQALVSALAATWLSGLWALRTQKFQWWDQSGSALGTFLGVLVMGCPACTITLASYLGLAGVLSGLPFYGVEANFLAVVLLLWGNYQLWFRNSNFPRKN